MTDSSNPDDATSDPGPSPLVDLRGAVGHPSSDVVDVEVADSGALTDATTDGGEGGLTGTDVAAARGALPVDVGRGHRPVPRPD